MEVNNLLLQAKFQRYTEAQVIRVLTQIDRDPDSPTFGCFDRNYWHYKIRDFPSAILQQGIFILEAIRCQRVALVAPIAAIESWCLGAMNALLRQVDRQGGVDEYYPFERSYPAAAFGLYALCRVLYDWQSAPQLLAAIDWAALQRLVNHVAGRTEEQASNQQATGLAGLALAAKLDHLSLPEGIVEQHATRLMDAQDPEGWFNEYGGPDFGYLTVTLDALVDYHEATRDSRAAAAIARAVNFLATLVGADGRLPSTLNSRNTDYVVPYGLVRAAANNLQAAWLVETLFEDIDQPTHPVWATDDRYHCHYIFASVIRSLPYLEAMKPGQAPPRHSTWLPGCGYWIYWSPDHQWTAYVAAHKGGLVRIHRRGLRAIADYGWRVHRQGSLWTTNWWSCHWMIQQTNQTLWVQGSAKKAQFHTATPAKHAVLRMLAWILRDKLIPLLKRVMIFRPSSGDGPVFERTVQINEQGIRIQDRLGAFTGATAVPSPRQNLRHVASADSFNPEEWLPSLLGEQEQALDQGLVVETTWKADS